MSTVFKMYNFIINVQVYIHNMYITTLWYTRFFNRIKIH